jgi:hypothetical protein
VEEQGQHAAAKDDLLEDRPHDQVAHRPPPLVRIDHRHSCHWSPFAAAAPSTVAVVGKDAAELVPEGQPQAPYERSQSPHGPPVAPPASSTAASAAAFEAQALRRRERHRCPAAAAAAAAAAESPHESFPRRGLGQEQHRQESPKVEARDEQ